MRIVLAALLFASPLTALASGEYCVIPRLTAGVPTAVEIEHIGKPFCGMAIINQKYVRLDDIAKAKEESDVVCDSNGACSKTARYYTDEKRVAAPFIIIFQGPRQRQNS